MTKWQKTSLVLCLILGLLVRLYKINSPIADWHSHRQADTVSVTRNFLKNGINWLLPTYHDLSNIQSGQDNPQGLRLVEYPIYNLASLGLHQINTLIKPTATIEFSSRLTSVFFSLISSYLIFLICQKIRKSFISSILAMATFLFLPFSIFYSRTALPENAAITFLLASILLFKKQPLFSAISLALSILTKPYTLIISTPIFILYSWELLKNKRFRKKTIVKLLFFAIISLTPFLLWRLWINQYPKLIPFSKWLFFTKKEFLSSNNWTPNPPKKLIPSLITFKPYWFRWLFFERITKLILGYFGIIPLFFGVFHHFKKLRRFTVASLTGILLYFAIVAGGNIQHDYYQILIIPFLAIILGFGFHPRHSSTKIRHNYLAGIIVISVISLSLSWQQIKGFYNINNPNIIIAGFTANSLIPANALVIAPYNGDTAFLFQTQHSGWPLEVYDLDHIKKQHPQKPIYLVSVNFDQYTNDMLEIYPAIAKNDQFTIVDLNQ